MENPEKSWILGSSCPFKTDKIFKDNFRVDRKTFHYILGIVGPDMETNDTRMRKCVEVGKKLAISLTVRTYTSSPIKN